MVTGGGKPSADPGPAAQAADGSPAGRFGLLLRRLRQASRLTQEEVAARSGLSVRTIADAESGRTRVLHRHSAEQLAAALGLAGPQQAGFVAAARGRNAASEAGAEPGPELSEVQQKTLPVGHARPPAQTGRGVGEAAGRSAVVPRELPATIGCFTGREAELTALTRLLERGDQREAATVVISAIGGTAGVGKTALAVYWAHQVAGRFPDGQLFVNLRGYDPGQPVAPADALAGLLRALGVPGLEIPDETEERARLYRSRLAGRRMLVLLDNARDGEQVRPLLPGDPGCVAVVTSRDALAGLVAADGARRLDLDVLPPADAAALLRSLIGARADADPGAVAALAGLCALLPLALRIAAELAVARRTIPLADLAAELAESRLDLLDAGEDRADVRAVFSWSYRQLPYDVARAFALLGLHPGADLDAYAAAALTETTAARARRVLSRLHRASLLQATGPGRYGMHDLLRAYAREQAAAYDGDGQCDQALTRLFDYYLAAAAAASDVAFPAEALRRPRVAPTAAVVPAMLGEAEARAWLDAERANLTAMVVHCAAHGWPDHATGLAGTLFRYLMTGSHLAEALTVYGHGLHAARRSGDLAAEAGALNGLGGIGIMRGHFRGAADHYEAALELYRRCGDRAREARVLHNLGVTQHQLHNHEAAADCYRQAIAAYGAAGDSLSAARALADLAAMETELGSYDQAAEHLQLAVPVLRDAKDELFEAGTLERIGDLSLRRGQLAPAAASFEQAMAIYRRLDYPAGVAHQLLSLGQVSLRQGDYQSAVTYLQQALVLFQRADNQHGQILTLRSLAQVLHAAGRPAAARAELATALKLAAETGNTHQLASAHSELAESHHQAGQDEQARHHWQQALALYTQLGAPEADQVASRLSTEDTTRVALTRHPHSSPG